MKKSAKRERNPWDKYNQIGPFKLPKVDDTGWILNEIPREYRDTARLGGFYVTRSDKKWTVEVLSEDVSKFFENDAHRYEIERYVDNVIYFAKKNELNNRKERTLKFIEKFHKKEDKGETK